MYTESIIIAIVFTILVFQPNILKNFSNNLVGRIIFVAIITGVTLYKTYLGLLLVLILVTLNQVQNIEGFTDNTESDTKAFRENHCKKNKTGGFLSTKKDDDKDWQTMFPNVKFSDDKGCDPCDSTCKFKTSTTTEQLQTEENIKPKSSHQFRTKKTQSDTDPSPCPGGSCKSVKTKGVNSSSISE